MTARRGWWSANGSASASGFALVGALLVGAAIGRWLGWGVISADMKYFGIPWTSHFQQFGFHGLATSDSNYNPPYLYLLVIGNALLPTSDPMTVTKAVSTAFDLVLALVVALLVKRHTASAPWLSPALAGAIVLALPTVLVNSALWGQCDAIFASFLLLGLLAAEGGDAVGCAVGVATSLAFKLQAAFTGPAALAVFLTFRRKWIAIGLGSATYLLWLVPAVIAGRPWRDALTVYMRQAEAGDDLALGAPNLWTIAKYGLAGPTGRWIGALVGLGVSLAFVVAFVWFARRQLLRTREHLVALAFTSAFMLPFLLPKMHERYFFPADILAVVLTARDRRWLPVAVLVQVGSLTAYMAYLLDVPSWTVRPLGILANCIVVGWLFLYWRRVGWSSSHSVPSATTLSAQDMAIQPALPS